MTTLNAVTLETIKSEYTNETLRDAARALSGEGLNHVGTHAGKHTVISRYSGKALDLDGFAKSVDVVIRCNGFRKVLSIDIEIAA